MNLLTKKFLRNKFLEYYRTSELKIPNNLKSREWGFILFDELPNIVMRRHKGYGSKREIEDYIYGIVPAHAFYSAAYYKHPSASTMNEKHWLGADLIFDLDADHISGVAEKSYSEMLRIVKKETLKLIDFLIKDFGFSEEVINIVFSGSRGYHIHVQDPRVFKLKSSERREIVDYISGIGFDYDSVLKKKKMAVGNKYPIVIDKKSVDMPTFGNRVANGIIEFFCAIRFEMEYIDGLKKLREIKGVNNVSKAEKILKSLYNFKTQEELRDRIFNEGLDQSTAMFSVRRFIAEQVSLKSVRGKTDEPVTTDIKRLIRMPTSLHGGSSMRVTPLSM
ncbi:MAG TPA: DNA primase catalytic subunit PriS, partial [Methanosarcinales archaeon]|nr:DNA primase catalytic subunit PriS [Methanosarcinales archaeon]